MGVIEKINVQEEAKGNFDAIIGDVDNRKEVNPDLLNLELCQGF